MMKKPKVEITKEMAAPMLKRLDEGLLDSLVSHQIVGPLTAAHYARALGLRHCMFDQTYAGQAIPASDEGKFLDRSVFWEGLSSIYEALDDPDVDAKFKKSGGLSMGRCLDEQLSSLRLDMSWSKTPAFDQSAWSQKWEQMWGAAPSMS